MEKVLNDLNQKLIKANKHKELTGLYKQLKTDQERIVFTFNVMNKYDILPKAIGKPKTAAEAERLRERGNKMFVTSPMNAKKCIDVLKLYTESAACAPYPSKELALAYANRSAVLFKLLKYKECMEDIDRALHLEYPDDLRAKLYVRKIECMNILSKPITDDVYNETLHWLDKMSMNDSREKLRVKLDTARTYRKETLKETTKKQLKSLSTPVLEMQNPEVPCASNALAIKYNKEFGRHVVATRKISPGEVIAIERPYSLLLKPENLHTHCTNCLNVSWANIPCDYCTCAMYCSVECKEIGWEKYHNIECVVFPPLLEMDFYILDFFSIRLVIQALKEANGIDNLRRELEEVDRCTDPRTKGFAADGIFYSDKYRSIYSLETNTDKRAVPDLFRRSMDSCYILYYLATRTTLFGSKLKGDLIALAKNDDVTFVGGLILRHQQMIPTNGHSFNEEHELDCAERGIAAMPFFSLLNHSCDANVLRHSRSDYMVIYAIYPIQKDEQILDNYGKHYAITPKKMRQQKLSKQYYFDCKCVTCQEDWPLYSDLKSFTTLVTDPVKQYKIQSVLRNFDTYVDLATEGDVFDKPEIVTDLLKMINVLYECAPMPCVEMNNVVETLKRVYDLHGNRFMIPNI